MAEKNYSEEEKAKQIIKEEEKEKGNNIGSNISDASNVPKPWEKSKEQISQGNQIGWHELKIEDFPTRGMFYPPGSAVNIRSATSGEIRHWSTLNDDDLSSIDDMLNYVLERCAKIKFVDDKIASWRDIKEIDRFYILLAIRELTFIKGENKLQVKISETKKIDVTKEMIDYVSFGEKLMKYYDNEKRCFALKFKSGKIIHVDIPSVGVTNWLKNYVTRKQRLQESFDQDYITYAPFMIRDWRGLNDSSYEKYIHESNNWSIGEISALTHIKELFSETIDPVVKYTEEGGAERVIPLNFQGGIKSLFLISDPFRELD